MTENKYMNYIVSMIEKLVNIPSPSGYCGEVLNMLDGEARAMGYETEFLNKGGLIVNVPGKNKDAAGINREVTGLCAHVDTLGAMVRSVTADGQLKFMPVGGYMMQTVEGEYCKIHARRCGQTFSGTVLTLQPSVHVYDDARTLERKADNMAVRLDEKVFSKEDVLALGIGVGDYISFAPRFEHTKSGFVKSRHLDDKASAAVLFGILKYIHESGKMPENALKIIITNYEEIGHGASCIPADITKLLAVDMGALGDDLSGDEYKVSICAMDSSGPYDYEMTNELIRIAENKKLNYAVDVFPHYGSDVSAALRGGNNICGALIGQGVHASHGMERTHEEGLHNTFELIKGFLGIDGE